jgi:predicted protein tyrosine phosphatase
MFEIKICSLDSADDYIDKWATKTISLLDPNLRDVYPSTPTRHVEFFNDIAQPFYGWIMPKMLHLRNCLEFSESFTNNDRVLIHCHAGVSRSTAIAIAILIQHGMSVGDAFDKVLEVRDCAWPNAEIIALTDVHFGLGGSLIDHIKIWKMEEQSKIKLVRSEADSKAKEEQVDFMKSWLNTLTNLEK